jgi:bloom syndrome protein
MSQLRGGHLRMLYITPEKFVHSPAMLSVLQDMYQSGRLARFVIDEAHCVSNWGHDFRRDYLRLCDLKRLFPKTPVLALTATATPPVQDDVIRVLQLQNCIRFQQSFNRQNLRYQVRKKGTRCVDEIAQLINSQFQEQCGIVYCNSRNDCEKVAAKLSEAGVRAQFFHAAMPAQLKESTQASWMNDDFPVIVATVAFGMVWVH